MVIAKYVKMALFTWGIWFGFPRGPLSHCLVIYSNTYWGHYGAPGKGLAMQRIPDSIGYRVARRGEQWERSRAVRGFVKVSLTFSGLAIATFVPGMIIDPVAHFDVVALLCSGCCASLVGALGFGVVALWIASKEI